METTTTDFSKFGSRERGMAKDLLEAWETQGLPKDFEDNEVTIMMNTNSGNVFLTNSEYQVAMMNGDKLESFYSCPQCGWEGFFDKVDDKEHRAKGKECREWLRDIAKSRED